MGRISDLECGFIARQEIDLSCAGRPASISRTGNRHGNDRILEHNLDQGRPTTLSYALDCLLCSPAKPLCARDRRSRAG